MGRGSDGYHHNRAVSGDLVHLHGQVEAVAIREIESRDVGVVVRLDTSANSPAPSLQSGQNHSRMDQRCSWNIDDAGARLTDHDALAYGQTLTDPPTVWPLTWRYWPTSQVGRV